MWTGPPTGRLLQLIRPHFFYFFFCYDYSGHVQENSDMILSSGDFIYCFLSCIVIYGFYRLLLNLKQFSHKRDSPPVPNSEGWTHSLLLVVVLLDYSLSILH